MPIEDPEKPENNGDGAGKVTDQAQLDAQFAERAKRAAAAERAKLLEALGVKDADEATALIAAARKSADGEKSEVERLRAAQAAATKEVEAARAELKQARLRNAIERALIGGGVRPEALPAAFILATQDADLDGEDPAAVKAAVDALVKDHAYLLAAAPAAPTPPKIGTTDRGGKVPAAVIDDEAALAAQFGIRPR